MALGFKVLTGHQRSDKALIDAFSKVPTAIISDNLNRMAAAGPRVRPMHAGGGLAGTALTVKTRPGDNLMIHKAADIAEPGDVLVVDGGEDLTNALIGELIVTHARSRGVVGFVINGAARDIDVIGADTFPVYAGGISHRGPYKDGPGEINVPIALDGMIIEPGDIIIGDLDGVVSIPRLEADAVLEACLQQLEKEANTLQAINGSGWDRSWVDEILRAKGCEGV
ncbi:RraA family protein [Vreelandella sp. EE22]